MEGGLRRPIRHTIDWQNSDYYNEELFEKELRRVADACHGCRRCVSLCNSFPTLFDLIDESETFEVDGVNYNQFEKVVDHCYLCDLCFLTKCPYVPPHDWEIDFPHLMLRAKVIRFKKNKTSMRDKVLTSTDLVGKLVSNKILSPIMNYLNSHKLFRYFLSFIMSIHIKAKLPKYTNLTAKSEAKNLEYNSSSVNKVAIFTTCYHNYNEPKIINDLSSVLKHNNITVRIIKNEVCCGMPKLELGDLISVQNAMKINATILNRYVIDGYKIIAPIPSCVLMYKQELPLLFPDNIILKKISENIYDPFEYLFMLHKQGELKTDFKNYLGSILYQVACHQRVQNIGLLTKKILELVPKTDVKTIERCSGHDGTYGVKKETHEIAVKIAKPIVSELQKQSYPIFTSDCSLAGNHISNLSDSKVDATHPITLIKNAYGIKNSEYK